MFDLDERDDLDGPAGLDGAADAGVSAAGSVLATMASLPAAVLSDDALAGAVLGLETARRFLDAAELACLAELDRRDVTETRFGHRSAAWLAHEAKLPRAVAAARVNTAVKITVDLPEVSDALREGSIGFDHARVLADAANCRNTDELAAVAGELCDLADLATFQRWQAEVRGLAELLDADGGHTPDPSDQRLSVKRVGELTTIAGQLAGDGAHIAQSALEQIADELFHRYTRDRTHTGETVPKRAQLLAEAFIELCRRGLATPLDASRPARAEATIVINAAQPDQITDTTGTRLTDTDVLLCDPLLWPIVTNFQGVPLALGRRQRLATAAQIRAINHRDGGCPFPGCDSPSTWNDTHHADEWAHGGHTDTDRMCRPCRPHHRLAHTTSWTLHLDPDGWTRWTRPDGHTFWGQQHQRQRAGPLPDD